MNKKTGIIVVIVALILLAMVAFGSGKKSEQKKPAVKQTQTVQKDEKTKTAFRYVSEARMKARKGDYAGAMALCDRAATIAPNEPVIKNCKKGVDYMLKRERERQR